MLENSTIYIDDREPQHIVETMIFLTSTPQFDHFFTTVQRIEVADFTYQNFCIERKTFDDYFASIKDGRIYEQVHNMSLNYNHAIIICSGSPTDLIETQLKGVYTQAMDNWFRYAIPTFFVKSDSLLCYEVIVACQKFGANLQPKMPVRRAKRVANDVILTVLNAFDMIGKIKAINIMKHFRTLKAVINAPLEELVKVDKIGKKTAMKFLKLTTKVWTGDKKK